VTLKLKLFGQLHVTAGATPITPLLRPRARRLLAYLLLHRHTPLSRQEIAFKLWLDSPEKEALRLFVETMGHPFFLEEIVRGLIEAGQIFASGGRWVGAFVEAAPGAVVLLPESLRETIRARLERLTEIARTFLRVAAGRRGDFDLPGRSRFVVQFEAGRQNRGCAFASQDLSSDGRHVGKRRFSVI
jgi:hypothetical protein